MPTSSTKEDYIPWSAGLLFGAGFLFMLGFASFESVTGYYLMDAWPLMPRIQAMTCAMRARDNHYQCRHNPSSGLQQAQDIYYPGDQVASGQFYGALFTVAGVTMFLVAAVRLHRKEKTRETVMRRTSVHSQITIAAVIPRFSSTSPCYGSLERTSLSCWVESFELWDSWATRQSVGCGERSGLVHTEIVHCHNGPLLVFG